MLFSCFFVTITILGYSSSCSENEIDTDCVNPCNTCEQKGRCDPPPTCQQGCDCKPGFFRDENGYCLPEQQCLGKPDNSPRCPKNAYYVTCAPLALPTCENPYSEPDYDNECVPGCVCRSGFLKRKDRQCVTPGRCFSKEDPRREGVCQEDEEYYECTPSCKNTCQNINNPGVKCRCGPPGCFCREGLVKRSDGRCVHPKNCPRLPSPNDSAPKCPKNAIFIKCGSPCPPTCDDMHPEPCEEKCITACYCKPGYLKRKDGVCVRPIDCNPRKKQERPALKCPENAIFIECGTPCPPTCEDQLPVCEEKCTKACYCKPGFLLKTDEAKCVKPENCNAIHKPDAVNCSMNEEPSDCVVPCNDCRIKGNCKFFACNKGCDCKKGYFRNKDGKCILASQCPVTMEPQSKCAADEQFYECTPSCKNTCENIYNPEAKCHCGPPSCFCREGLVKRKDGKCIPPEKCEAIPQPQCNTDEQYYECTPSCRNTCRNFVNTAAKCYCGPPGCFCKEGLVKREDGKCVPPHQCRVLPVPECGEDQKFYNCTPNCKNTCENFSNPAIKCGCGPPSCFCKDGLVKRADGKCIPPKQCHKCLLPGEEFQECGSTCPDNCKNRGRHTPGSCPYRCNRGCFCKKGLYRTKSGQCVPLKDCDSERYFTTPKPSINTEKAVTLAVTAPNDFHGCPNRDECEAYCKSLGDFIGLCIGKDRLHCRCA